MKTTKNTPAAKTAQKDTNLYVDLTNELYRAFDFFNKKFAAGKLSRPVITMQPAGKKKAEGWFCHNIWSVKDTVAHEINICAESLAKGIDQTLDTLLHEMAHLHNFETNDNKVVDCTEQQRHNEIFKTAAEKFGLVVTSSKRFGFGHTNLSAATKALIDKELKPNADLFKIYRKLYNEIKEKKDKKDADKKKLSPVMIGQDTKQLIESGAKAHDCDQKELTEKAVKYYLHMLNSKPKSIPAEFRIVTNTEKSQAAADAKKAKTAEPSKKAAKNAK